MICHLDCVPRLGIFMWIYSWQMMRKCSSLSSGQDPECQSYHISLFLLLFSGRLKDKVQVLIQLWNLIFIVQLRTVFLSFVCSYSCLLETSCCLFTLQSYGHFYSALLQMMVDNTVCEKFLIHAETPHLMTPSWMWLMFPWESRIYLRNQDCASVGNLLLEVLWESSFWSPIWE